MGEVTLQKPVQERYFEMLLNAGWPGRTLPQSR